MVYRRKIPLFSRLEAREAGPARRSSSPNPAFYEHSILTVLSGEENINTHSVCGAR